MQDHRVGEDFDGTIGQRRRLRPVRQKLRSNLYVDGLIHVSTSSNDYYEYDNRCPSPASASRSRMYLYASGDRPKVGREVRVNLDERKIDLEPVQRRSHSSGQWTAGCRPQNPPQRSKPGNRRGEKAMKTYKVALWLQALWWSLVAKRHG